MLHPAPASPHADDWITPGAAAVMLGVSARHVSDLVDTGELDGYRPARTGGGAGHRRVSLASVRRRLGQESAA